jgi:hypothetical protein
MSMNISTNSSYQSIIVIEVAVGTNYFFEIAKLNIAIAFNLVAKNTTIT